MWSSMRHTHILREMLLAIKVLIHLRAGIVLEFLGANEFDDRPFIVMPYMKNGNARDC